MSPKSDIYREVTRLMAAGELESAMTYHEAQKGRLSDCERLESLGNFHFYKRQKQEAINHYEAAMIQCPDYDCARYHYLLGVQAETQGKLVEAHDRYNASIQAEPTFVDAYIELGGLLTKFGDNELAATVYEDALCIDANDLRIYANLTEVYRALAANKKEFQSRFERAEEQYAEAAKRLPSVGPEFQW